MFKYKTIFIFHDNCKNGCRHCFCKPVPSASLETVEEVVSQLAYKGVEAKIYVTDQSKPEVTHLIKKIGYGAVELKDEFSEELVDKFDKKRTVFGFSLHGHVAEIHDFLCGSGNFDKTIMAIRNAMNSHLPNVRIYCVVHKRNHRYIEDICELAAKLGAKGVTFLRLAYMGRARNLPADIFFDENSFVDFFHSIDRARVAFRERVHIGLVPQSWGPRSVAKLKVDYLKKILKGRPRQVCEGGRSKITIHSGNGKIFPCNFCVTDERLSIGMYTRNGIEIRLIGIQDPHRNDRIEEPCRSCSWLQYCGGGCRGMAIADSLQMTGKFNFNSGLHLCPIYLGLSKSFSLTHMTEATGRA